MWIGLAAAVILIIGTAAGTIAYFSKSFTSDNNTAKAASFNVDVVNENGETIADGEFDLGEDLFPGMEPRQVYSFQMKRNDTELPFNYSMELLTSGGLFPADGDSPIVLTLQRDNNGEWEDIDNPGSFTMANDTEAYRIMAEWPHGENDINFQGKTGNIKLEIVATQIDGENNNSINIETITDGTAPTGKPEIVALEFTKRGYGGYTLYVNDGDGHSMYISQNRRLNQETPENLARYLAIALNGSRLTQVVAFREHWEITQDGAQVIFTSKVNKRYPDFDFYTHTEEQGENRIDIQEGVAGDEGTKQVSILTVDSSNYHDETLNFTFNDGDETMEGTIDVKAGDKSADVAAKVAVALGSLNNWDVAHEKGSADITLTAKDAAANKDIRISIQ